MKSSLPIIGKVALLGLLLIKFDDGNNKPVMSEFLSKTFWLFRRYTTYEQKVPIINKIRAGISEFKLVEFSDNEYAVYCE